MSANGISPFLDLRLFYLASGLVLGVREGSAEAAVPFFLRLPGQNSEETGSDVSAAQLPEHTRRTSCTLIIQAATFKIEGSGFQLWSGVKRCRRLIDRIMGAHQRRKQPKKLRRIFPFFFLFFVLFCTIRRRWPIGLVLLVCNAD